MTLVSRRGLALFLGLLALLTVALATPAPAVLLLMPNTGPFITAVIAIAALAWTVMQRGRRAGGLSPVLRPAAASAMAGSRRPLG